MYLYVYLILVNCFCIHCFKIIKLLLLQEQPQPQREGIKRHSTYFKCLQETMIRANLFWNTHLSKNRKTWAVGKLSHLLMCELKAQILLGKHLKKCSKSKEVFRRAIVCFPILRKLSRSKTKLLLWRKAIYKFLWGWLTLYYYSQNAAWIQLVGGKTSFTSQT